MQAHAPAHAAMPTIDLTDVSDGEVSQPSKRRKVAEQHSAAMHIAEAGAAAGCSTASTGGKELAATAGTDVVWNIHLPHFRDECGVFLFTGAPTASNSSHCQMVGA